MKKNSIFSIVRNGLYEQYLKLITNIDVNCQNEYGQNLLQEAIVSNMDEIAIDLVKNSWKVFWIFISVCNIYRNEYTPKLKGTKKCNWRFVDFGANASSFSIIKTIQDLTIR